MTREIKFRCWDEDLKQMLDLHEVTVRAMNVTHNPVMQYTGLKDRHGKEIYEGDILLIPDEDVVPVTDEGQGPIEDCSHLVPVEFRNGEFGFEIPKTDDGETGWFTWRTWGEYDDPAKLEIIGNIYENPELLESSKK